MREAEIERRLVTDLKRLGCLVYKFVSPGAPGVPDRIVITKRGTVTFVELKTETGRLSPQQKVRLKDLRTHGQNTAVLYGPADVEAFVAQVRREVANVDESLQM